MPLAKDVLKATSEIIQYASKIPGISYYDIKEKAYKDENEDWIDALKIKRTRENIALYLRHKRKKDMVQYNRPQQESYRAALEAETKYEEKQKRLREEYVEENAHDDLNRS